MQQQPPRNEQYSEQYNTPASAQMQDPASQTHGGRGGTSVMGEPTNPSSQPTAQGFADNTSQSAGAYRPSGGSYVSPPFDNSPSGPHTQRPDQPLSAEQQNASMPDQPLSAEQQPASTDNSHPYVHTTALPGSSGKTPMDSIMTVVNKWGKKAEDMTGNVWGHLRTGPNVADTAFGRIALGAKAMSEGGMENIYRQNFDVAPDETLLKTFASYLSTSTGPVAGTIYLSNQKVAFCSDRPLAIPGSAPTDGQHADTNGVQSGSKASAAPQQQQDQQHQQQWVYYKVALPISQLQAVEATESKQKKINEKYIQVKTVDGHEFWFMGFVNYDKALKNLQEAMANRNSSPSANAAPAAAGGGATQTRNYSPMNSPQSTDAGYNQSAAGAGATQRREYSPMDSTQSTNAGYNPSAYEEQGYPTTTNERNPQGINTVGAGKYAGRESEAQAYPTGRAARAGAPAADQGNSPYDATGRINRGATQPAATSETQNYPTTDHRAAAPHGQEYMNAPPTSDNPPPSYNSVN